MFGISELTDEIISLSRTVRALGKTVAKLTKSLGCSSPVGTLKAIRIGEDEMGKMKYKVNLPQLADPAAENNKDLKHGLFTPSFDGVKQDAIQTTIGQLDIPEYKAPKGVQLGASFVFVDDDGNLSKNPAIMTPFLVQDDIPPSDPVGGLGMETLGEEADEVPTA